MRTIGAAILGLFAGLLAGILFTEIGGRVLAAVGTTSGAATMIGLGISFVLPVGGIVGAILGIVIERRIRRAQSRA